MMAPLTLELRDLMLSLASPALLVSLKIFIACEEYNGEGGAW